MQNNIVFKEDNIKEELLESLGIRNANFIEKLQPDFVKDKVDEFISYGNHLNYAHLFVENYGDYLYIKVRSHINNKSNELSIELSPYIRGYSNSIAFSCVGNDVFGVVKDPDVKRFNKNEDYPYATNIYELIKSKAENLDLDLLIYEDYNDIYPDVASTFVLSPGDLHASFDL